MPADNHVKASSNVKLSRAGCPFAARGTCEGFDTPQRPPGSEGAPCWNGLLSPPLSMCLGDSRNALT